MERWLPFLVCAVFLSIPAHAQTIIDEESEEEVDVFPIGGIRTGHLGINPIASVRLSGGTAVYQVGVVVGYALMPLYQIGGSVVMGNRLYSRTNRR